MRTVITIIVWRINIKMLLQQRHRNQGPISVVNDIFIGYFCGIMKCKIQQRINI